MTKSTNAKVKSIQKKQARRAQKDRSNRGKAGTDRLKNLNKPAQPTQQQQKEIILEQKQTPFVNVPEKKEGIFSKVKKWWKR